MIKHQNIHNFIIICVFFLFIVQTCSQVKYWEDLDDNERAIILKDSNTNKLAIDYYNSTFKISDDSLTFEMLDKISDKGKFNPFYFHVFNNILLGADGALAETMGDYCLKTLLNYPTYLIDYFSYLNQKTASLELYTIYILMLAEELYYNENYIKYNVNKQSETDYTFKLVKKKLDTIFEDLNKTYKVFMNDIKTELRKLNSKHN